jgi:hypothetical protein
MSSPSVKAAALGEEEVFPECFGCNSRGRSLPRVPGLRLSGKIVSSPSVAFGEDFFLNKQTAPEATNGVNSSPSARTTLGKAFPECTSFGSRGRRLYREEIPRALFPECCTRGRLPRVQLSLPRVHSTLVEATASRSDMAVLYSYVSFCFVLDEKRKQSNPQFSLTEKISQKHA